MAKKATSSPVHELALEKAAREKWRSSGLGDEQASQLQLEVLSKSEVAAAGIQPVLGAVKIPYFNVDGSRMEFFRVRFLEEPQGFQLKKPRRYSQPPGSGVEIYLPPLVDWAAVVADTQQEIIITEGEFKAACGCAHGLNVIGLGGVYNWRSKTDGTPLIPSLSGINWKGRPVVILYDSDTATNQEVMRAQRKLAEELTRRGARVRTATVPAAPDGSKMGLDDFLVATGPEGTELLRAELAAAPLTNEGARLWELNERVLLVRDQGVVVEVETGNRMEVHKFQSAIYSNWAYDEVTAKGAIVQKPLAPRWLRWEHRAEVDTMVYAPGKDRRLTTEGRRAWNTWRRWGVEPKPGSVDPWLWLLEFIFHDAPEEDKKWVQQWFAYPLQHPGVKLYTSVVVWGRHQGTGKTLLGEALMRIYGENAQKITDANLRGSFNSWAQRKQFVLGDEVTGNDRRADADRIKGMITSEWLTINEKFLPEYTVPDCINYYFTSNHPDAFLLEDTDRRFFVHEIVQPPADLRYYREFDRWYRGEGASALFHHLLQVDLAGFDPRAPAKVTQAKLEMIRDTASALDGWCRDLAVHPDDVLVHGFGDSVGRSCDLYSPSQLLGVFDPGGTGKAKATGMAKHLKAAGIRPANGGSPVRTGAGPTRLYIVRNLHKWRSANHSELAEHWNAHFKVTKKF